MAAGRSPGGALPSVHRLKVCSVAAFDSERGLFRIIRSRGRFALTAGFTADGVTYLFPEEAVYLLERGSMELLADEIPLSLEEGRTLLSARSRLNGLLEGSDGDSALGDAHCSFAAYCALKHAGYIVRRPCASRPARAAPAAAAVAAPAEPPDAAAEGPAARERATMQRLFARFAWHDEASDSEGDGGDFDEAAPEAKDQGEAAFDLFFVWPPEATATFRRSAPPPPAFAVAVVSAADPAPRLLASGRALGSLCRSLAPTPLRVASVGGHSVVMLGVSEARAPACETLFQVRSSGRPLPVAKAPRAAAPPPRPPRPSPPAPRR